MSRYKYQYIIILVLSLSGSLVQSQTYGSGNEDLFTKEKECFVHRVQSDFREAGVRQNIDNEHWLFSVLVTPDNLSVTTGDAVTVAHTNLES